MRRHVECERTGGPQAWRRQHDAPEVFANERGLYNRSNIGANQFENVHSDFIGKITDRQRGYASSNIVANALKGGVEALKQLGKLIQLSESFSFQ